MVTGENLLENSPTDPPSDKVTSHKPRPRRVATHPPPSASVIPPIPVRSPLRPPSRSLSNTATSSYMPAPIPRPSRPATPPPLDIDDLPVILDDAVVPVTPPQEPSPPATPPMTKRQHALLELLSSERAYASDLALIREVHMPLALGMEVKLPNSSPPPIPSDTPPMTTEDVRTIFNNIAELALFSDQFCEALELALGSLLDGGTGEDHVGALFLEIIPELERPYKQYITRHPAALSHLQSLPQTPELTAYLSQTQTVASAHSHAWDLASLLIKPVQRLLKYPLLLAAIIDETPDTHPDKTNLQNARKSLEEVARNVNEGRRRAEVVKEVLAAKKKPVNVGVSASVNLTKMKSLRHGSKPPADDTNGEAAQVAKYQSELKRIDVFAHQFAKCIVEWTKATQQSLRSLHGWAISFGKVIGLSPDQGSEAFDAFVGVVSEHLSPLCTKLEARIADSLLKELAYLLATTTQPLKLLASMNEQQPLHYHLLTMPMSAKNRPPPALLAASTNYIALRGQLAAELPRYLTLLHQGLAAFVRKLAVIQAEFWRDTRDAWAELWEMLRVEGEMNAGHAETVNVWFARWRDVEAVVALLTITQRKKIYQEPPGYVEAMQQGPQTPPSKKTAPVVNVLAALDPVHSSINPQTVSGPLPLARSTKTRVRGASDASLATPKKNGSSSSGMVLPKMSHDSLPFSGKHSHLQKKKPTEDFTEHLPSPPPSAARQRPKTGTLPRTKSMPLPQPSSESDQTAGITLPFAERTMSHRSSASSKTLVGGEGDSTSGSARHSQELPEDNDASGAALERGRSSRKPSLRRKFADSFRTPGTPVRQRSLSKNATPTVDTRMSFFDDFESLPSSPTSTKPPHASLYSAAATPPVWPSPSRDHRDSWTSKRAKYVCRVVHACMPPAAVSYYSFPFFTLVENDFYEVLQEAGHPSVHPKLPLYVDDGEDCLLLCRDMNGTVGWALASFLEPLVTGTSLI